MIIDDPDQFFLYLVYYPPAYRKYFMSQEINNHLSLSSPLSLSFQRTRSKGPDCSDPPTLQLLATFLLSSFKIQGGGGCFSSNKEFLLWNSVESILNQYDTLNFHYEASNLKTRVKCNQLYTCICVFPGNKRTPWESPPSAWDIGLSTQSHHVEMSWPFILDLVLLWWIFRKAMNIHHMHKLPHTVRFLTIVTH